MMSFRLLLGLGLALLALGAVAGNFDPVRGDPRFQALVKEIRLCDRRAGGALPQRKATDYGLQIAKGLGVNSTVN